MTQTLRKTIAPEDMFLFSCMEIFSPNFLLLPKAETRFPMSFMNEFTCLICLGDLFISTDSYNVEIREVDGQLQSAGT